MNLGGQENIIALHAGGTQSLAHLTLVVIQFRRVDVAIPYPECPLNDIDALTRSQGPCAKADERNARTGYFDNRLSAHETYSLAAVGNRFLPISFYHGYA
jgi:hypothetical protein